MGAFAEHGASDAAYSAIKRMIRLKTLKPGQRLSEVSLAHEAGVSRTPVRDALKRLASEGWLRAVPNLGVWVASPTRREVEQAYEVRARLELWGLEAAMPNVTPLLISRLEDALEAERAIYEGRAEPELYPETNVSFHMCVAEAGGNEILCRHIRTAIERTDIYITLFDDYFDFVHNNSLSDHGELLELIKSRDAEAAADKIDRHIWSGFRDLRLDR